MVIFLASSLLSIPLPYAIVSAVVATLFIRYPFYRRFFFFFVSMCITTIYGLLLCVILAPLGKRTDIIYYSAKVMHVVCSFLTGVRVEVEGAEHLKGEKARVIVANHQASLDVFFMACVMPHNCVVMAKKSLRYAPVIGSFLILTRALLIDRKNHENAMQTLQKASDDIKTHHLSVFAYPEGTRARLADASMLPFKKGVFHLAQQGQVPVVPVVIENYSHIYSGQDRYFKSGVIRVKVLPPISTENMTTEDVDTLTQTTRDRMVETLKALSDRKQQ